MEPFLQGIITAFQLIATLDPEVMQIALLSLYVSGVAVALGALAGIPLGAVLSFRNFFGKRFAVTLNSTLMGLPPVVVGLVVYLLLSAAGPFGSLQLLFSPTAMIIAQLVMVVPIIAGITYASLNAVAKQLREKAFSLGATETQMALTALREARFGIITAIITGFGAAISEVGAVLLVGGNIRWHTRTLTTATLLETRMGEFGVAIALGIILLLMAFAINVALNRMQHAGATHQ
jgi:tungstate transport system permease protein